MPWNFPLWQVFRFAAPALDGRQRGPAQARGERDRLRRSRSRRVFKDAGFPPPLFRALLIGSERVAGVIEAREVKAVTLTGSTPAGQAVAARAGAVLKKTVLELGGSDPYVVLEDADLDAGRRDLRRLAPHQRRAELHRGQAVHRREDVLRCVRGAVRRAHGGAPAWAIPLADGTDVGPLARRDLRDALHAAGRDERGAGSARPPGRHDPGQGRERSIPLTVLTDVRKGMPAYDEETFGPVAAVIAASGREPTRCGSRTTLRSASVRRSSRATRPAASAWRASSRPAAASSTRSCESDPRLPFGGIKESGYGRELADFGIREFVNIKTIYVK